MTTDPEMPPGERDPLDREGPLGALIGEDYAAANGEDAAPDYDSEPRGPGCCGTLGCVFSLFLLLLIGGAIYGVWWLSDPFVGWRHVYLGGSVAEIDEAPEEKTVFVAGAAVIRYRAPLTDVPVGLVAERIEVRGAFADDVILRGVRVTCEEGAVFVRDLDVRAVRFRDRGINVEGERRVHTFP